jgi:hypothetical protein
LLPSYVSSLDKRHISAALRGYGAHRLETRDLDTCYASEFPLFVASRCVCLFSVLQCANGSFVSLTNPRSLKYSTAEMLLLARKHVALLLQRIKRYNCYSEPH